MTSDTEDRYTNEYLDRAQADARLADARRRAQTQTGPPAGFANLGGFFKFLLILGWIQLVGWALGAAIFLISMLLLALAAS